MVKNPHANARDVRDMGSVPGSGRSPEGGYGNLLQYFCLKNPTDKGLVSYSPYRHEELDMTEIT